MSEKNSLGIYAEEKTALFIDGANLYATARSLEFDIDYRKMLNFFKQQSRLIRAFYYTALVEDDNFTSIRPLVDWLDYNGYTMITKQAKVYHDPNTDKRRIKGSIEMELAIDMMDMADHIDHAIIFSGDGDYRRLLEAVQRKGVRVSVISTVKTNPAMIADELRRQADNFIDLIDLSRMIRRESAGNAPYDRESSPRRDAKPRDDHRGYYADDEDYSAPAPKSLGRSPGGSRQEYKKKNNGFNNQRITTIPGEDDYS